MSMIDEKHIVLAERTTERLVELLIDLFEGPESLLAAMAEHGAAPLVSMPKEAYRDGLEKFRNAVSQAWAYFDELSLLHGVISPELDKLNAIPNDKALRAHQALFKSLGATFDYFRSIRLPDNELPNPSIIQARFMTLHRHISDAKSEMEAFMTATQPSNDNIH